MILVLFAPLERRRQFSLQKVDISLPIKSLQSLHLLLNDFAEEMGSKIEESGFSDCLSRIIRSGRARRISFKVALPEEAGPLPERAMDRITSALRALLPGVDKEGNGVLVAP